MFPTRWNGSHGDLNLAVRFRVVALSAHGSVQVVSDKHVRLMIDFTESRTHLEEQDFDSR